MLVLIPIPAALPRLAAVLLAGALLEVALSEVLAQQLLFLDEALPSNQYIHHPRVPCLRLDLFYPLFQSAKDPRN